MFNEKEIISKIIELLKDNILIDGEDFSINEESDLIADFQMDSIDIVSLGIEVEDIYGVKLEPEDFTSIKVTPKGVAKLIIAKSKQNSTTR